MIDFAKIAAGATVSTEAELPRTARKADEVNPFLALVTTAKKDGKRYDLAGRFSVSPYKGRKAACEAQTVTAKLHAAARALDCKIAVRRLDPTSTDTALTFKVIK